METRAKIWIYPLVLMGALLMFTSGCKKDLQVDPFGVEGIHYPPSVITVEVSEITQTTAVSGGNIISNGSSATAIQGICWSDDLGIPSTSYPNIEYSSGAPNYRITMTGLKPNTKYIVCAFATNSYGTGYGTGITFTTQP
jgi:hypothetical protein